MALLSLRDVHRLVERVDIGGGRQIDVSGLTGDDITALLTRFPKMFGLFSDAGGNIALLPSDLIGAIVAACQRETGNEEMEKLARAEPIGVSLKILQAMGRTTFPDGFGPFLQGLRSGSGAINDAVELVLRESASILPQPPKNSAQPATPPSGN